MRRKVLMWMFVLVIVPLPVVGELFKVLHYPLIWSLYIIIHILIILNYPKWKVIIVTGLVLSSIKYVTEFATNGYDDEEFRRLVVGSFINWFIMLTFGYLRIKYEQYLKEIKCVQERLQETNEELETFWNYSIDPVFLISAQGEIQRVNSAFERLFEYREEEVLGSNDIIIPPNMIHEPRENDQRFRNGEAVLSHETKRVTKSGRLVDIIASYTPVRDNKGNIIGATAFYKDVTERKKLDQTLKENEERYRLITENMTDLVALLDSRGTLQYASPSRQKILGLSSEESQGTTPFERMHPEDRLVIQQAFKQVYSDKKSAKAEFRYQHKDGHYLWVESLGTPVI